VSPRSLSSIRVVTRGIYWMNNCMQWSSVFTMLLRLKFRVWWWTHISEVSMHSKPVLAQSGSTEQVRVGKATPGEVLWRAEWATPMATALTVPNRTPKWGWSFRWVLVSAGAHHSIWKLWWLRSYLKICTTEKCTGSRCFASFHRGKPYWMCTRTSWDSY